MPSSDLTWTQANSPVNRIDEYRVFKSTNVLPSAAGFLDSFVLLTTLPVVADPEPPFGDTHPLSFSDTAVDFSSNFYCYRVDAVSVLVGEATGGSPQTGVGPSNNICIGTPSQPAVLSGDEISDTQIDLSWVNGAAGILPVFSTCIFRSVNSGPFTLLAEVFQPTITFSDITVDLSGSNTYEYFVISKDEVDIESDASNTVGFGFDIDGLIAIANSGATNKQIMVSEDAGVTWVQKQIIAASWQDLAFAPDKGALGLGRIVALNFNLVTTIYFSDDGGDSWTEGSTPLAAGMSAVTYSQSLGLFAAISNNAGTNGNKVMTSSDGITWAFVSTPAFMDNVFWAVIHFDPVNALFLCGSNGTAASSADGITFTERTTPGTTQMGDQIATDAAGLSVADNPSDISNLRTLDGETWIDVGNPPGNGWAGGAVGMAFGAGLFVASIAGPAFETSPDGTANWINRSIPVPGNSGIYAGITFSIPLALFVAVNSSNFPNQVVTSVDGITWVVQDLTGNDSNAVWRAVLPIKRGTSLVKQEMVMVEIDPSAPRAGLSVDGNNWSTAVNGAPSPFRTDDVAYSPTLKLYASCGDGFVQTSPDGINWTDRTVTAQDWQEIYWDDRLLLFVCTATESGTNQIMTSTDGIVWITRVVPSNFRGGAIVSDSVGVIIVCGFNASTNPAGNNLFSSDAITWNVAATDPQQAVVAVAYDTSRNRFVQIISTGQCNVSSDGDTWTLNINSADIGGGLNSSSSGMTYSASLDLLVFVGATGIRSSGDGGATWTLRDADDFNDVEYSVALGKFFACNDAFPTLKTSVDGITWNENPDPDNYDGDWSGIALGDVL